MKIVPKFHQIFSLCPQKLTTFPVLQALLRFPSNFPRILEVVHEKLKVGPTPKVQSNCAAQCAKRNEETGGQHLLIKAAKME